MGGPWTQILSCTMWYIWPEKICSKTYVFLWHAFQKFFFGIVAWHQHGPPLLFFFFFFLVGPSLALAKQTSPAGWCGGLFFCLRSGLGCSSFRPLSTTTKRERERETCMHEAGAALPTLLKDKNATFVRAKSMLRCQN